jgi:hypothetical protein
MKKRWRKVMERAHSPWLWGPIAFGLGAAAALAIVRVPTLWSAEGAGWASAVGTSAAVVMALGLAQAESRRRRREAIEQARGMSLLLLLPLIDWQQQIRLLAHHVDQQRDMAITQSFDREGGETLKIPGLLDKRLERIHVLGAAAVPLSSAVYNAAIAKKMEWAVREAVRNYVGENIDVLESFRKTLLAACSDLTKAIELMSGYVHGKTT